METGCVNAATTTLPSDVNATLAKLLDLLERDKKAEVVKCAVLLAVMTIAIVHIELLHFTESNKNYL